MISINKFSRLTKPTFLYLFKLKKHIFMKKSKMKKQPLNEEFKRMQKLAGLVNENEIDLLSFVKQNKDEIAKQIEAVRLEDIMIDDLGDVGAIGIYADGTDEMEGGVSFRFAKDVDGKFRGEDFSKPKPINVNGVELMYIGYNI